jgi:hypothetical protein
MPSSLSEEQRQERYESAVAALKGIAPRDEIEGMLAAQMVATHSAAMDCLRRAVLEQQTFHGRDMALKHASKLLATYTRQLEALDKHRGKGQQKITVEHVTVNSGGQAIVGNVTAGAGKVPGAPTVEPAAGSDVPSLSHNPMPLAPGFAVEGSQRHRQKTGLRKP